MKEEKRTIIEVNEKKVTPVDVLCYYANIMDYFRVVAAMYAFYKAKDSPVIFVICYFISFILDAFDGMAARAAGQTSKLGATLDMVTDRISTAGLLAILSGFYEKYSVTFVYLIMLDVGSHWLQTHSGFLVNVKNDNHKNLGEKFFLLKLYYTNRNVLGIVCLGAEVFLLLLYFNHFYPKLMTYPAYLGFFYVNFAIYIFKQIVSIIQIFGASSRIAEWDAKVATDKLNGKSS
jgi:CDP-diacylglycerol--inositol 3-phosphatidyltransferase